MATNRQAKKQADRKESDIVDDYNIPEINLPMMCGFLDLIHRLSFTGCDSSMSEND